MKVNSLRQSVQLLLLSDVGMAWIRFLIIRIYVFYLKLILQTGSQQNLQEICLLLPHKDMDFLTQPATSTQTSGEKESENPTSLEIETVSSAKDGEEIIAVVANNETFDLDIENVLSVEDEDEEEINENIFNRDRLLPIYEKSRSNPCPSKDVVIAMLEGIPDNLPAKLILSQSKENACFMISLNYLEDWKDTLSDDLGVWSPTGKRTYYKLLLSINGRTTIQSVSGKSDADVKAFRYLYCYPPCKDFKRIIIRVFSKTEVGWTSESHLLSQYFTKKGYDALLPK